MDELRMGALVSRPGNPPHLAGFWMNEPRWAKEHKYSPTAFLFVGEAIFLQLELGEDEAGKPAVSRRIFTYAIEGDQIWVSEPREGDPQTSSGRWRFDHESNLWLEIGGEWVPLVPATLKALAGRRFPHAYLQHTIELIRSTGQQYSEVYRPKVDLQ